MAYSKLKLYNAALSIIKQTKLDALSDDRPERYQLDDEYDEAVAYMLSEGLWNFALRTVVLTASTSIEPDFGHSYVFDKPDDYVRLNAISADGYFYDTLDDYIDEGNYWITNTNPIYVSYISDGVNYGADKAKWTPQFTRATEFHLATRIAPHIASFSVTEQDSLEKKAIMHLRNARSKDAMDQPAKGPPVGRLVRARGGARNRMMRNS